MMQVKRKVIMKNAWKPVQFDKKMHRKSFMNCILRKIMCNKVAQIYERFKLMDNINPLFKPLSKHMLLKPCKADGHVV